MESQSLNNNENILSQAWWAGVHAVQGVLAVKKALIDQPIVDKKPVKVLAIGKAAASMAQGVVEAGVSISEGLVLTKYKHTDEAIANNPLFRSFEAAHPVPDENSIQAGSFALDFVTSCQPDETLLLLVSGGASALCELPREGWDLALIQQKTEALLAQGAAIGEINAARSEMSQVKAGNLLKAFTGQAVVSLAISDVEGDSIGVIGSGIGSAPANFSCDYRLEYVATNAIAREAIARVLKDNGVKVQANKESLYDDVNVVCDQISKTLLSGESGAYVWGGEPTVVLPESPGKGGRNQSLALGLAIKLKGANVQVLVAGTDGTDGPTEAAGGLINGQTVDAISPAEDALMRADAGTYLESRGGLFSSGPTGTNVMDVVVAIKQ